MFLFKTVLEALLVLFVASRIPRELRILRTNRTAPCWDRTGNDRGWPDIWRPEGMPIPLFGKRRFSTVVILVCIGWVLCIIGTDVYYRMARTYPALSDAVYRVDMICHIEGKSSIGNFKVRDDLSLAWSGTATAISADGDMLTARHVVDLGFTRSEVCRPAFEYALMQMGIFGGHISSCDMTVDGPGGTWHGTSVATPLYGAACDATGRMRLVWWPDNDATVVAVDDRSDLALIRVRGSSLRYLPMVRTPVPPATPLVAMGAPRDQAYEIVRTGMVVAPCMLQRDTRIFTGVMPMLRMSQWLEHGMSGGPTTANGVLVGINSQIDPKEPHNSYAVPASYAAAWYDWIRQTGTMRPNAVCP